MKMHFDKQVDLKSKENDRSRVDPHFITFKVVSDSERTQKHEHLFNIHVQSYIERGKTMLARL